MNSTVENTKSENDAPPSGQAVAPNPALQAARAGAWLGFSTMKYVYTVPNWLGGWMIRSLAQVTFYVMLGTFLADSERTAYMIVGMAVYMSVTEPMMASASSTWDRQQGTLALLLAAPRGFTTVIVLRSWFFPLSGAATGILSLLILGPVFGVTLSLGQAVVVGLLIVATSICTYGMGLMAGSLSLRFPAWRNIFSNLLLVWMFALCGVVIATDFWPSWLQWCAQVFPLTHTLEVIRHIVEGDSGLRLAQVLLALGVGAAWFAGAIVSLWRFSIATRRDGTVDFTD